MLQKLRDQTQSLFFKVLVGAIIFVLAIFGFGAFNLFLTTDPSVASVNGEDITQGTLTVEAERERRRLAAQFGESFDPNMIDPIMLQNSVINQLISRMLLSQAADDLGVGASDKQINEIVISNPNFLIDGQFEENTYRRVVNMLGYTPTEFLTLTGDLIAVEQLRNGIVESAISTEWELREQARILSQRRDIAYLTFDEASFLDTVDVSDDDVRVRYEENLLDFMTEESVDVAYVELTLDALINDPNIEVGEEDIIAGYEREKAASLGDEQRDSRHILLQITDERTAEAAVAELEALRARIEAGESFADLALEFSEDPGSKAVGGDLGPVSRGLFAPEFEDALWALEVGHISDPVQTDFGVHLIELKEVIATEFPSLEEMRAEIETGLRQAEAERLFIDRVRELDNLAFEQPESLEGISTALGLEIQTAQAITRSTGSGIFGNVTLRESLFTSEVLDQGFNSPAVEYLENRAVVSRVTMQHEPETIPFETVEADIRAEIAGERARLALEGAHADALTRVEADENVSVVANDLGLTWQTRELARRNDVGVPSEVLSEAFSMTRPVDGKQVGSAQGADGTRYVITMTRVEDGDLSTMTETEIQGMRQFLANRAQTVDFDGYYQALEKDASISRPDF
jgi:peptidyl-prolyl cis-trans isomerase D